MSDRPEFMLNKILATVGPACADAETLVRLIEEGARVFRINFSHGSFDDYARSLAAVREAGERTGVPVGVLGDLSGPKIRVGEVRGGGVMLDPGDRVEFQCAPTVGGADGREPTETQGVVFSTTYPDIVGDVQPGQRLLIDDGNVRCLVVEKTGDGEEQRLVCRTTVGGLVTTSKGINLPDTTLAMPSVTEKDWACAGWALEHGLDFLALSFVRRGEDIRALKRGLTERLTARGAAGLLPPIIAKIEKPEALGDLDAIVHESDALMVARGDLGVEMDVTEVPVIQKRVIRLAHDYGKPVIVATQMLQSMVEAPAPTRAEVSDVANAIFDGADAVMLSGETAVGKFPVQAVRMMGRIALTTQGHLLLEARPPRKLQESRYRTAALAHGVSVVVRDLDAKLVVTWSERGGGARYLSQNRLGVPILAASSSPEALRKMSLLFGVVPVRMDRPESAQAFVEHVDDYVLRRGWARPGDAMVVVMGEPIGTPGVTNQLRVHHLGDVCRLDWPAPSGRG